MSQFLECPACGTRFPQGSPFCPKCQAISSVQAAAPIPRSEADPGTSPAEPDAITDELRTASGSDREQTIDLGADAANSETKLLSSSDLESDLTGNWNYARPAAPENPPLRNFGDYTIEEEIARGGMGVVYRAQHQKLNRVVALKMIRSAELAGEDEVRRFQVEAEAAAALDHPAIVPIYEVGEIEGQQFYTMGYIDGKSLAAVLAEGPLTPTNAASLVSQVADGMHYAHSKGVIHRDLKPANILLEPFDESRGSAGERSSQRFGSLSATRSSTAESSIPWQPRITDFGLAKKTQSESDLTSTGQVLGTPSYMPPEQARGEMDVGPAADVYALGAVLYAALVGRPPFQSASVLETIKQVVEQDPLPPSRFSSAISRDLDNICLKCLEKSPARRYESAAALADDLYSFLEGKPVKARPVNVAERFWRWCRRKPMAATALLAGGTAALVTIVLVLVGTQLRLTQEKSQRLAREAELSREKAQRLEGEAELQRQELKVAEERAISERRLAATQEFFATISRVREQNTLAQGGWAYAGQEAMRRALKLGVEHADIPQLRSIVARCLAGLDAQQIAEIPMPTGYRSHRVAVDADRRRFAVATLKNRFQLYVCVCDFPTGKTTHSLLVTPRSLLTFDGIRHIQFLEGGNTLAAVTRTGFLHRWDLTKSGSPLTTVPIPYRIDQRIALDPANNRALLCHDDNLYLWPNFDDEETKLLKEGVDHVWDISPDGKLAVVRSDSNSHVIDLESKKPVLKTKLSKGWFDTHGHVVFKSSEAFMIYDIKTGEVLQTLRDPLSRVLHNNTVRNVDFSPDGALMVSGGNDQRVSIWDLTSGELKLSFFLGGEDEIFPMFASNEHLVTTADKKAVIFSLNGRDVQQARALHRIVDSFDLSIDPVRFLTGGSHAGGATVDLWDESGTRRLATRYLGGASLRPVVRLNDNATHVAVGSLDADRIWAWRLRPALRLAESPVEQETRKAEGKKYDIRTQTPASPQDCEVAAGGSGWFVEGEDQLVRRSIDDDLKELSRWNNSLAGRLTGVGRVSRVIVRQHRVAVVTMSGQLVLFHDEDQSIVSQRVIRQGTTAVDLNPSQTLAVCGTAEGEVVLVPLANQELQEGESPPHLDLVTSVAFSPDGSLLATSSRDRTVRFWSVDEDGITALMRFELPRVPLRLRFLSSGDLVGLLQGERGLRVWRTEVLRQKLKEFELGW